MKAKSYIIPLILMLFWASSLHAQKLGGGLIIGPAFSTMNLSSIDSTTFRADFTGGVRNALIPKRSIFGGEIDIIYSRQGTSSKKGLDFDGNTIRYLKSRTTSTCRCC